MSVQFIIHITGHKIDRITGHIAGNFTGRFTLLVILPSYFQSFQVSVHFISHIAGHNILHITCDIK